MHGDEDKWRVLSDPRSPKERETLLLRAAPRAANRSSGTQQANIQPSPRRRRGPSPRPPAPRRAPAARAAAPAAHGAFLAAPHPEGPPGQGRPSAEPGPWGGGGRRQRRDSGWQGCRAPPGGAGRGGVRCPRAERRGPAWRAGEARRGGAGQAAEPGLPEGLAGPLRSARQRRRPGASAEPPPLGAAPDGAPPPAPRELPPPASPVPGGRSSAQHWGEGKRGVPLWRHRLPCPAQTSRASAAPGGRGRSRGEPRSSLLSRLCRQGRGSSLLSPEGYDLPSYSFPPAPCMRPGLFSRSLTPAGRKERESTALAGHGLSAAGVPAWSEGRGSRCLQPAPSGTGAAGPSGLPAAVAPARPRRPAHLGPAAVPPCQSCGGRRRELPQPQEQRLLWPSGLSRRGRGFPLEKSGVVSVWRLSASFPGQRRAPRAAAFQGSRPKETSGNGNPIPRGPRQTVPGDSCGVCHRGEPMSLRRGKRWGKREISCPSGRDRRFLADTAAARSVVQVEKLSVGFISTLTVLCTKKKK